MKERIKEDQLLNETHFPVQIILNEIRSNRFITTFNAMSEGVGFGVDSGACTFPGDLDAFDITQGFNFTGVEFGLYSGEDVIISYDDLYFYLSIICTSYISEFPDKKETIENDLKKYKKMYGIK